LTSHRAERELAMEVIFFSGLIVAMTGLLLLLRSLLVGGTSKPNKYQRVYFMSFDDGGDDRQDSDDEWPSLIGTDETSAPKVSGLSEDERIQLATMEEQIRNR
jgi:hypothetical protein